MGGRGNDATCVSTGSTCRCQGGSPVPSVKPSHQLSCGVGRISTAYRGRTRGSEAGRRGRLQQNPRAASRVPHPAATRRRDPHAPPAQPPPGLTSVGRAGDFHSAASRESGIKGNCSGGPGGRPGGNPKPPQLFPVCRPAGPRGARGDEGGVPPSALLALSAAASCDPALGLSVPHPSRTAASSH